MASLTGIVDKVMQNSGTGWCVLRVELDGEKYISAVGTLPLVREGERYEFSGAFVVHPRFGEQFKFSSAKQILPTDEEGLIEYFTGLAPGVGPVKAAAIVKTLGTGCLAQIAKQGASPLLAVKGLKGEQAEAIAEAVQGNRILADLTAMIAKQGISSRMAAKIYDQYGARSIDVLRGNPYILADEVDGIGFVKADMVARNMGVPKDSVFRAMAATKWVLNEASNGHGHCYLRPSEIKRQIEAKLGKDTFTDDLMKRVVASMVEAKEIYRVGDYIYLRSMYSQEYRLAQKVGEMLHG